MRRTALLLTVLTLILAVGLPQAMAASKKAQALRQANGLVGFTPSEAFLAGGFIADEMDPAFIYGPIKKFVSKRACKATWLIEEKEKERVEKADPANPVEFTVYLEEDCPDKVTYYVFMNQSAFTPKQWIDWRQQFHKSKAEGEYGATKAKLEKALKDGVAVRGELRFILVGGELSPVAPEDFLRKELKVAPLYDLKQEKLLGK